jgi:ABC-type uncharacterized transport system ATPase subunit
MTSPAVHIQALRKVYVVSQQEASAKAALQGLVRRQKIEVPAVDGISFDVAAGEIVGSLAGRVATLFRNIGVRKI